LPADDPAEFLKKLGDREIGILSDYVRLWTHSIDELLTKLRDTLPAEGMLGEIHYWRDMAKILDALQTELKLPFVELTV